MSDDVVYRGRWEPYDICAQCGAGRNDGVYDFKICNSCADTELPVFALARFVCTKKRWLLPDLGYYEYSSKDVSGREIPSHLWGDRVVFCYDPTD